MYQVVFWAKVMAGCCFISDISFLIMLLYIKKNLQISGKLEKYYLGWLKSLEPKQ